MLFRSEASYLVYNASRVTALDHPDDETRQKLVLAGIVSCISFMPATSNHFPDEKTHDGANNLPNKILREQNFVLTQLFSFAMVSFMAADFSSKKPRNRELLTKFSKDDGNSKINGC